MEVGSHELLAQLVALGSSSLLQYVSQSGMWAAAPAAKSAMANVLSLAAEEREDTTRFTRFLQKKHIRLPPLGAFPSHFTTMNFVTVEYLLPKLISEHIKENAAIERLVNRISDEEIRAMAQGYLDKKCRHLETLRELAESKTPAPV